jgi:hypothetical protein
MSSHYSYDIDERNLRTKLKGNEGAFTEDVWLKFESYQQANLKAPGIDDVVKKISFTINRKVILPVIFGAIIISFSLLLFNFINIKSKPKSNLVATTNTVKPEVKKETPKPVEVKKTIPVEIKKDSVTVATPSIATTPTVAVIITPTIAAITLTEEKKTVQKENMWTALESDNIFVDPNKASTVVGSIRAKEKYNAIEETVYFIKVEFTKNGKQEFGYIRKGILAKDVVTQTNIASQPNTTPRKKREKKSAETLESIKAPSMLSSSSEEEPELK